MKNINLLLIMSFMLLSCGTFKEAGKVLRNEKITNTDEFFVKKKQPLMLPPDYKNIPEPGTLSDKQLTEEEKIKKMLKVPKEQVLSKDTSSNVENSILNKIRK